MEGQPQTQVDRRPLLKWIQSLWGWKLQASVVTTTLLLYLLTPYLDYRNKFGPNPCFTNLWAFTLSVFSLLTLLSLYRAIHGYVRSVAADPANSAVAFPARVRTAGILLAGFLVAACLPATFRAVSHPREAMVFWHDEGITLEQAQEFITGARTRPEFRITQGWIVYLPVALLLKGLHAVVPVDYILTNIAYRAAVLTILFLAVYYTVRLVWQISQSLPLALGVAVIAWGRLDFFNFGLPIDRPDAMQLLFVLLSLLNLHRFWVGGQSKAWFLGVLFAGLAFGSKYAGHLLAPAILLTWIAHWSKPEVRQAYADRLSYWRAAVGWFVLSTTIIPIASFFLFSPYHLIGVRQVVYFFQTHLAIYQSGNVFNLPDYQAPPRLELWWNIVTARYVLDYWLTVLGLIFAAAALVKNLAALRRGTVNAGEVLLLAWGGTYGAFMVYQYGLADYRYLMPMQFVLPFFLLGPALWLRPVLSSLRFPAASFVQFGAVAACVLLCVPRLADARRFLKVFRSEESKPAYFAVGRHLDRMVAPGDDPSILIVDLVYVPPRFTRVHTHNVDVTDKLLAEHRFDYVVMTDFMYSKYAGKPTEGNEAQYDPIYKTYFVDVVQTYTRFKADTHPDYRYVSSFKNLHLFRRNDPVRQERIEEIQVRPASRTRP